MKQSAESGRESRWLRALMRVHATANHDFCPWVNRYVYWLKQPIGWFVIAAGASLLIGLTLAPQGFVMFAAIVAFMLLGVLWPWIEMRGLACRLRFVKTRVREGESVRVCLDIINRWPWAVRGLTVQRGFFADADADGNPAAVALARVPGWSHSSYNWTYQPPRRGVYPIEAPFLTTGFPFGIWHARSAIDVVGQLIAWPQTIRLDAIPPVSGPDLTVAGMLSDHVGDEGDMLGVRPYRQGDSLRRIHWAQTARHDQLIVCERQATARRTVQVMIDTNPLVHCGSLTQGSLEWAIRLGATICQQFHAHNSQVECVAAGHCVIAEPGPLGIKRVLDALARLVPQTPARETAIRNPAARGCLFSIVVTTDLGIERLARNGSLGGARVVVLRTAGFDTMKVGAFDSSNDPSLTSGAWIHIERADQAAASFRRQWERICHDVWCTV